MRKTLLLLTLPALVFFQCCNQPENESPNTLDETSINEVQEKKLIPETGKVNGDTIFLSGKFVLFYGPDSTSFMAQKIPADSLAYFRQMSLSLMDTLKQYPEIRAMYSTVSYFKIFLQSGSDMVISRKSMVYQTGVLAGDGLQPPTMKTGIHSTAVNMEFIKKYFMLK